MEAIKNGLEKGAGAPPPALFLTRRPLPWNHFLARPKPLSVLSSKMAAEHSKDYLSLAQPNTPALQATESVDSRACLLGNLIP